LFTTILLRLGAFSNSISISAAETCLGLLIIIAAVKIYRNREFSVFKKGFFIFYMLMILAELISTFAGVDPERSVKDLTSFWVMSYLPVIYVLFTGRDKMGYLVYVFAGAVAASVFGVLEKFIVPLERADGFFSHALTYGNVLALVAITALGVLVMGLCKNTFQKRLTYLTLFTVITALVLTISRGPILAFIISVFIMLVYRYRLKGLAAAILFTALITGFVFSVPQIKHRFVDTISNIHDTKSSIGTRIVLWEASSKAIMMRPFFGYGKRNFKDEVSKYIDVPTSSRAHAHNSYIQYTFLHGFFGLFALLGFLGSLLWEISRRMRMNGFIKTALFVLIVFLLEGLTENNFSDSEVAMMCYSLIGLMLAPGRPAISIDDDLVEFTESQQS